MKRLIKDGDIIFDGIHSRAELEKMAFEKLENYETAEEELGITFQDIVQGRKQCFVTNGKGAIFKGCISDVHIFLKEIDITIEMPTESGKGLIHPTLTFSTVNKRCINQVRDFEHPIRWALTREELE